MPKNAGNPLDVQNIPTLQRKVTVGWLIPERVILIQAYGELDLIDRETAHSQIINLIHSCRTAQVHLISDTKQMKHIPWSIFNRPSPLATHPRRGWWINIGTVSTVRINWLSRLLAQLSRRRYIYCDTMPEAIRMLQKLDPTLPDLNTAFRTDIQAAT